MYIFVDISLLNRYISEKPKGRENKSKERAKRRVGRARSKKEGIPPPPPKKGSSAAMAVADDAVVEDAMAEDTVVDESAANH